MKNISYIITFLKIILTISLFVSIGYILYKLIPGGTLLHDEAVYLTKARNLLSGTPADEFRNYRPMGMVYIGWIILHWGTTETFVRLFGVLMGSITIIFSLLLVWKLSDYFTGFLFAMILGTSDVFLKEAPRFLNDIPSAGLLLGGIFFAYIAIEDEKKSVFSFVPSLLFSFAFYLRYGTIGVLIYLLISLVIIVQYLNKSDLAIRNYLLSVLLFGFLMSFHFLFSLKVEGSFLGILSNASIVDGKANPIYTFDYYIREFPKNIAGMVMGFFVCSGFLFSILSIALFKLKFFSVFTLNLSLLALISFMSICLYHPENRYAFFSLVLFGIIGIVTYSNVLKKMGQLYWLVFLGLILISLYYFAPINYHRIESSNNAQENGFVTLSRYVHDQRFHSDGCVIWVSNFRPQVSWYSGCNTLPPKNDKGVFINQYLKYYRMTKYSIYNTRSRDFEINQNSATELGFNGNIDNTFRTNTPNIVLYSISNISLNINKLNDGVLNEE